MANTCSLGRNSDGDGEERGEVLPAPARVAFPTAQEYIGGIWGWAASGWAYTNK